MRKRAGFTLVELLVVMAIISLIAGLVVPAVRRAQERAKQAVCMSNLRQLGQAFLMYASDNEGFLPAWFAPTPVASGEWIGNQGMYVGKCWHGELIRKGYVNNPAVFACPKDDFRRNPVRCKNGDNAPQIINGVQRISYGLIPNSSGARVGMDNYNPIGQASDSRLILAWEEDQCYTEDAATGIGEYFDAAEAGYPVPADLNAPVGRHLGTFNILWLAGNVTSCTEEQFAGHASNLIWFNRTHTTGD